MLDRNQLPPTCNKYGKFLNKNLHEEMARQLTLIDWNIFIRINRNELIAGQWNGAKKHILSPNVVAFTRRFNIVRFNILILVCIFIYIYSLYYLIFFVS